MKINYYYLILMIHSVVQAQTDSTSVTVLKGIPTISLSYQEREQPVINNITQVIGGTESFFSNQYVVSSFCTESVAPSLASPGWVLTCGSRACQGYGYSGGYVSEMQLPTVRLLCLK